MEFVNRLSLPTTLRERVFYGFSIILAASAVILAIFGAFFNYAAVPLNDMWNGMLGFLHQFFEGNVSAIWNPHNEHRMVLTRILFVFNAVLFDNSSVLLVAINYLLAAAGAVIFGRLIWLRTNKDASERTLSLGLVALVTASLFLWCQEENLTWGFQSQFFLVYLLPIVALYLLFVSTQTESRAPFFWAAFLGVLSVGTMANGILAPFLMLIFGLLLGIKRERLLVLGALSLLLPLLYFHNYNPPGGGNASQLATFMNQTEGVLDYTFLYLASPISYLLETTAINVFDAREDYELGLQFRVYLGFSLALLTAIKLLEFRSAQPDRATSALLILFIAYVGASAFMTSLGRYPIAGLITAESSRYTTPAIWAWAALLALWAPNIVGLARARVYARSISQILIGAILLLIVGSQYFEVQPDADTQYRKQLAALSLELKAQDREVEQLVYPIPEHIDSIVDRARLSNTSIFGAAHLQDLELKIGSQLDSNAIPGDLPNCLGHLDETDPTGSADWLRVRGWLFLVEMDRTGLLIITNNQNTIIGYGLTGHRRPDVKDAIHPKALNAGYFGYVKPQTPGSEIRLYNTASNIACSLRVQL